MKNKIFQELLRNEATEVLSSELLVIKCCSKDSFQCLAPDSTQFSNLTIFPMLFIIVR